MNKLFGHFTALFLFLLSSAPTSNAKPLALVWNGPGVCAPSCAPAAAKVARMAGYRTQYINPQNMATTPFAEARLWVQPGGKSSIAAAAMGPALMQKIRNFVASGGRYVGYCAGMFLSTKEIASRGVHGFGFVPGRTELYLREDPPARFERVTIANGIGSGVRRVYYAGGPMLHLSENEAATAGAEVLARYSNGAIAAIHVPYGAGRVSVSGFHPESGVLWGLNRLRFDWDGSDRGFAVKMIRLTER